MKKAYNKDIWRAIWKGKKRFFSIMLITTLGVTMFSGLKAACEDLRYSADELLDAQNLFDISVVSTLGLTEEDVYALGALDEVEAVEGAYSETVHMELGEKDCSIALKTLSANGINKPYILEGELPQKADEVAVTIRFHDDTGMGIGDKVCIEEDLEEEEDPTFVYKEYTITAVVIDPQDLNNAEGAVAFRASATDDYTLFVTPEAVDSEVYTIVYMTLVGGRDLFCYGEEYTSLVNDVIDEIETKIKSQREQARYDKITGDAYEELADAEAEVNEELADAKEKLTEAESEMEEAKQELADAEAELKESEKEAASEFASARQEIADGKAQLASGWEQIQSAEAQLADGEAQLAQAKQELEQTEANTFTQIGDGLIQIATNLDTVAGTKTGLKQQETEVITTFGELWPADAWNAYVGAIKEAYVQVIENEQSDEAAVAAEIERATQEEQNTFLSALSKSVQTITLGLDEQIMMLNTMDSDYETQLTTLSAQKEMIAALPEQLPQLAMGLGQVEATEQVLNAQMTNLNEQKALAEQEIAYAWTQIEEQEAQLAYARKQLEENKGALNYNENQLSEGEASLAQKEAEVNQQIADGWSEIAKGRQELSDGQIELDDGIAEYEEKKAEALQEIEDAKKEIEDIDMTQWYVQDRTSLAGYANIESDAAAIETIGTIFPMVFFVVAILISLTTITRMVEEDRGLIGTYKALGFTDKEIRRKYVIYAFSASVFGSILGSVGAFVVLPGIIFIIFQEMYVLPEYVFRFNLLYGISGPVVFMAGIVVATAVACKTELKQTPAALMRPKTPRSGSRVFLERITPIWNHLSFLNKVTARNLFRYKKRLFMTIAGIMGCMALMLFGFAVKDSVADVKQRQYGQVNRYDLLAVTTAADNDLLLSYVEDDPQVESFMNMQIETLKLKNEQGDKESVQLYVIPEGEDIETYVHLEDINDTALTLKDGDIYVTQNASTMMKFEAGDTLTLQRMNLEQGSITVTAVVKNYLGNIVFMTQATYEKLFGTFEPNGLLLNFSEKCTDQEGYAEELSKKEGVLSAMSTEGLNDDFEQAFKLMNVVVYVVIVMAACLAFAVLFTLATTNISERQRELATIKVLGFYDREVHLYVNKETMILTFVGILAGLPLGYAFAQTLTDILKMPGLHLAVSLHTESYLMASGLSLLFALIVNVITNRSLDVIDPVEALKSIE